MDENIPNLEREMDIQIHKAQKTPNNLNLNTATLRPFKIKSSEVKDNFKSGKKKERRYIHRSPHKTMGRFLNRNFSGKERMRWHTQNIERREFKPRILYLVKLSFRNGGGQRLAWPTKTEGVNYHQTCLLRDAEGGSVWKNTN